MPDEKLARPSGDETTMTNGQADFETKVRESLPEEPNSSEDEIPNTGFLAWLQVVGSFFIFFNTW